MRTQTRNTHMSATIRAVGASLITILAVTACGKKDAAATPSTPVTVSIGPENMTVVAQSTLNSGPAISGSLVADRTAQIRAEIGGSVVAVLIEPGNRVSKGTPLARIDDSAVREAWLSAKSSVTQATLAADIALREQGRAEKLLAAGAIAENTLEAARRNYLASQAQLEDAKARFASSQVNVGDIVSPGNAMFTVVDPSSMRLEGAVPSDQLGAVRLGAPVKFSVTGYPGKDFTGTITNIYPSADPSTRQVRLFVKIPNSGGLVAGLYATGRVASVTRQGLVAPANAVDQRGIKPFVMRLKNGKVERVEVSLGVRDEGTERVEILGGIAVGDSLLIGAAQGITVGTPVKISAPSDKPTAQKN
jgi:membrane fusion protein (multidrug efflux system)